MSVGVSKGRSVAVLVSSGCPGGLLETFWCYLGCILGSSWVYLGSCWGHVGFMVGSCWAHVGPCWGYVGTMLEHLGILGAVLEHLASTYAVKTVNFKKVPSV